MISNFIYNFSWKATRNTIQETLNKITKKKLYKIRGFHKDYSLNFAHIIVHKVEEKDIEKYVERAIQAGWYGISWIDIEAGEE